MDAQLKAQWIAALRSGEYRQGEGKLRDGGNYCCLGVLCDIVDPGAWEDDTFFYDGRYVGGSLPGSIALSTLGEAGPFPNVDGILPFEDRTNSVVSLAMLNDDGMPFDRIADIIEWAF